MPRTAGFLVTDADCNGVFQPKGGYIPTADNSIILDGNTIFARYNVTIAGGQSTRCPSWDQITSAIVAVAYSLAFADCAHFIPQNKTTYYSASPSLVVGQQLWKDAALTIKADFGSYTDDTHQISVDNTGFITAVTTCPKVTINYNIQVFDSPAMTNERFYIEQFGFKVVDTTVNASGSINLPANTPLLFKVIGSPGYLWILVRSTQGTTIFTNEGDVGEITQSLSFTTGQSPISVEVTISGF